MNITVITSCTDRKAVSTPNQLTHADFRQGPAHVLLREAELGPCMLPAGQMYTGEQHFRLMQGVNRARYAGHTVQVHIVSAGYGVVAENRLIAPYEATFNNMDRAEAAVWAQSLSIPAALADILGKPADRVLVLLGERYMEAGCLEVANAIAAPTWVLCGKAVASRLPRGLKPIELMQTDTTVFGAGMVSLKGEIGARMLLQPEIDPLKVVERAREHAMTQPSQIDLFDLAA
jgi:hypothetical protein